MYKRNPHPLPLTSEEAAPHGLPACTSTAPDSRTGISWYCTRPEGHDGLHEAAGLHGRVYAEWDDEK